MEIRVAAILAVIHFIKSAQSWTSLFIFEIKKKLFDRSIKLFRFRFLNGVQSYNWHIVTF